SVASGVVIVSSVALYTWMQAKDRDGAGGILTGLMTPEGQKMLRLCAAMIGVLIALLAIGGLTAIDPTPSG
ncbi:MAG: ABC transporter permease, partial [Paracoccaceae bacterium]